MEVWSQYFSTSSFRWSRTFLVVYVRVIFAPYHIKQVYFCGCSHPRSPQQMRKLKALLSWNTMAKMAGLKMKKTSRSALWLTLMSSRLKTLCIAFLKLLVTAIVSLFFSFWGIKMEFHCSQSRVCWAAEGTDEALLWKDLAHKFVSRWFQVSSYRN